MCAEAVWWRCHRRIIADYLLVAGEQVMHILGRSHVDQACLTPGADVRNDGSVLYPAQTPTGNEARAAVGSAAKGDEQSGDDADHGESVKMPSGRPLSSLRPQRWRGRSRPRPP
jgi:hypothetical protein